MPFDNTFAHTGGIGGQVSPIAGGGGIDQNAVLQFLLRMFQQRGMVPPGIARQTGYPGQPALNPWLPPAQQGPGPWYDPGAQPAPNPWSPPAQQKPPEVWLDPGAIHAPPGDIWHQPPVQPPGPWLPPAQQKPPSPWFDPGAIRAPGPWLPPAIQPPNPWLPPAVKAPNPWLPPAVQPPGPGPVTAWSLGQQMFKPSAMPMFSTLFNRR